MYSAELNASSHQPLLSPSSLHQARVLVSPKMKLLLLLLSLQFALCSCQITISSGPNSTFWKGCILRKKPLMDSTSDMNDPCNKCAMRWDAKRVVRRKGFPQRMYNCTDFCNRVTLCTHARYHNGKDNGSYPICWECQNFKHEHIKFNMIIEKLLCPPECVTCVGSRDLPRAFECAQSCQGLPTFCYPKENEMLHRKCYQAESWYGCEFNLVQSASNLTEQCRNCAKLADGPRYGQECSVDCDGLPAFARKDARGELEYYTCSPPSPIAHAELFRFEIPRFLLKYFHSSNPRNLYPNEMIDNLQNYAGFLRKFINAPFNMTLMTFKRPRGFEDTRIL